MKHPDLPLLHTTAFKLAVKSVIIYGLLLLLVLASLYLISYSQIDQQLNQQLEQELSNLVNKTSETGTQGLIDEITQRQSIPSHIYMLVSAEGKKLAGNLRDWPEGLDDADTTARAMWINDEAIPLEIHDDDAYWPVVTALLDDGTQLLLARSVDQAEYLQEISELLVDALPITILFSMLIALVLGYQMLRRMDIIRSTARQIMQGDLSQRIPVTDRADEFDQMANQLNSMLDRIQQLIKGMRDVTDNIAHDLRSPLTRLRNQLEITLLEPRNEQEYQTVLQKSIVEVDSIIKTFNALLSIAQAEAGNRRSIWGEVDLNNMILDLMDLYKPLTEDKNQYLKFSNGQPAKIYGSRDLLVQSFGNLLENAIKYTPEGGSILIKVKNTEHHVEVTVSDSGPGIPNEEKLHVLEKFVRLESSRHTTGNGLGLSLVQAVARLHHAKLELKDNQPGLAVIQTFEKNNNRYA